eukprot:gb/GEZN01000261.1/.p1 GENE.gb/GEZN01000261.1/~~gb/GEZN01000261.1/.p1  ORF type:complete len:1635 (-),score=200.58 gb/GEZN01000261.1/:380-5008(-)
MFSTFGRHSGWSKEVGPSRPHTSPISLSKISESTQEIPSISSLHSVKANEGSSSRKEKDVTLAQSSDGGGLEASHVGALKHISSPTSIQKPKSKRPIKTGMSVLDRMHAFQEETPPPKRSSPHKKLSPAQSQSEKELKSHKNDFFAVSPSSTAHASDSAPLDQAKNNLKSPTANVKNPSAEQTFEDVSGNIPAEVEGIQSATSPPTRKAPTRKAPTSPNVVESTAQSSKSTEGDNLHRSLPQKAAAADKPWTGSKPTNQSQSIGAPSHAQDLPSVAQVADGIVMSARASGATATMEPTQNLSSMQPHPSLSAGGKLDVSSVLASAPVQVATSVALGKSPHLSSPRHFARAELNVAVPAPIVQNSKIEGIQGAVLEASGNMTLSSTGGESCTVRSDGQLTLSDGTKGFVSGSQVQSDGSILLCDGAIYRPGEGTVTLPDGKTVVQNANLGFALPAGATRITDGSIGLADGSYRLPSGTIISPDGELRFPDGRKQKPDKRFKITPYSEFRIYILFLVSLRLLVELPDRKVVNVLNGIISSPEGKIGLVSGSILEADGSFRFMDGSRALNDGSVLLSNGKKVSNVNLAFELGEGEEKMIDGTVILLDGSYRYPSGSIVADTGALLQRDKQETRPAPGWTSVLYEVTGPNSKRTWIVSNFDEELAFNEGTVLLPNGTRISLTSGQCSRKDATGSTLQGCISGSIFHPDGTIEYPDGSKKTKENILMLDGKVVPAVEPKDGKKRHSLCDGSWGLSDGSYLFPSGTKLLQDGKTLVLTDGSKRAVDGRFLLWIIVFTFYLRYVGAAWSLSGLYARLRGGEMVQIMSGSWYRIDGTAGYVTGSIQLPNGSFIFPDGSVLSTDGKVTLENGAVVENANKGYKCNDEELELYRDGSVRLADHSYRYPSGTVMLKEAKLQNTRGEVDFVQPGWTVTRYHVNDPELDLEQYWMVSVYNEEAGRNLRARTVVTFEEGTANWYTGLVERADGSVACVSGSVVRTSDGAVLYPDGSVKLKGDSQREPMKREPYESLLWDGSLRLSDGSYMFPSGAKLLATGKLVKSDGSVQSLAGGWKLVLYSVKPPVFWAFATVTEAEIKSQETILEPPQTIALPGGEVVHLKDGKITSKDGKDQGCFSGSTVLPDGSFAFPDGSIKAKDGKVMLRWCGKATEDVNTKSPLKKDELALWDGSRLLPDGSFLYPSGCLFLMDGTIQDSEGKQRRLAAGFTLQIYTTTIGADESKKGQLLVSSYDEAVGKATAAAAASGRFESGTLVNLPGGSVARLEDGSIQDKDGKLIGCISGSIAKLEGVFSFPDGSQKKDGVVTLLDKSVVKDATPAELEAGSTKLVDGAVRRKDGSYQWPSGALIQMDGKIVRGNQEARAQTGWSLQVYKLDFPDKTKGSLIISAYDPNAKPQGGAKVTLPDKSTVDIEDGKITSVDGQVLGCASGSVLRPDGSTAFLDGSVKHKDGKVTLMDGSPVPDANLQVLEGAVKFCDGSLRLKDGSYRFPSGAIITKQGALTDRNGQAAQRKGEIALFNFSFPDGTGGALFITKFS